MADSNFPKIGAPATRALEAAGYTNLKQLTKVTEVELAQLHGMGPKALGILREALKAQGLSFKQDKTGKTAKEERLARQPHG
jgi:DNA-directed RNA polymerase alpha subunit